MQEGKVLVTIKSKNPYKVLERLEPFFVDGMGLEVFKASLDHDEIDYGDGIEMSFDFDEK